MYRLLLESGWKPEKKQKLLCGGEAMTKDLAGALTAVSDEVWNMYGSDGNNGLVVRLPVENGEAAPLIENRWTIRGCIFWTAS